MVTWWYHFLLGLLTFWQPTPIQRNCHSNFKTPAIWNAFYQTNNCLMQSGVYTGSVLVVSSSPAIQRSHGPCPWGCSSPQLIWAQVCLHRNNNIGAGTSTWSSILLSRNWKLPIWNIIGAAYNLLAKINLLDFPHGEHFFRIEILVVAYIFPYSIVPPIKNGGWETKSGKSFLSAQFDIK